MSFWQGRRVFLTGHTGFKGSWLSLWLADLGAQVTGYALPPPTDPSLFELAGVGSHLTHIVGDVRDAAALTHALTAAAPEIVIHMAAQPLVRLSYDIPVETYAVNVMGTVHLLEAVRQASGVRAVLCITSDKCYENREWLWGYRENEAMGGFDPYSSSKGCAELVIAAYRQSFFQNGVAVASARAGNVIGGGDWAKDRLVPDMMQFFMKNERPLIRFPAAIRPWQHVLEPLRGYLMLAEKLWHGDKTFAEGWNFGPADSDARTVQWLADRLAALWGNEAGWDTVPGENPHEAHYLKLDCAKAHARLGWQPAWTLEDALAGIVEWYKALGRGADMAEVTRRQIGSYAGQCGMMMPSHEKVF